MSQQHNVTITVYLGLLPPHSYRATLGNRSFPTTVFQFATHQRSPVLLHPFTPSLSNLSIHPPHSNSPALTPALLFSNNARSASYITKLTIVIQYRGLQRLIHRKIQSQLISNNARSASYITKLTIVIQYRGLQRLTHRKIQSQLISNNALSASNKAHHSNPVSRPSASHTPQN